MKKTEFRQDPAIPYAVIKLRSVRCIFYFFVVFQSTGITICLEYAYLNNIVALFDIMQ